MERKRERKTNRKKAVTSLMAAALALILLLSGTFAWFYTTNKINEFDGNGTVPDKLKNSAVLHDDFDKWAEDGVHRKDVFVENTGEAALFVRIRLDEYMEIDGESLVAGATKADESTWQRHTEENTVFAEHWNWVLGGESIQYKPSEEGKQGVVSRYDEEGNDTLTGADRLEWTHNNKATEVVTMEEYKKLQEEGKSFAGWIMDADGYAYWYEKLPAGEATGRLLNQVSLKDTISEESEYFYGINVVFETVDEDDLDAWLNETETEDGSRPEEATDDAKDLLEDMSDQYGNDEETDIGEEIENTPEGGTVTIDGIEWFVLKKEAAERTAELITKGDVATGTYYNDDYGYYWKWSTSRIYTWLNEDWYNGLSQELKNILVAQTKATNRPGYALDTNGDPTTSNVYLLSRSEYETYKEQYGEVLYGTGSSNFWWLRSPSPSWTTGDAYRVSRLTGKIDGHYVNTTAGIRPALTVKYK